MANTPDVDESGHSRAQAMIRLVSVGKVFPGTAAPAVDDLSFEVAEGETVVLVGPSGCGKTTTLKMINRLIDPTSGRIVVAGTDVADVPAPELRRHIGYVIQQIGLFPHKSIRDNIATVPALLGWDKDVIGERVDELVDLVDLDASMLDRYPAELSGGQRQRVGVARALAADPPVLLMDEPFGAVDPIVRGRLQEELIALQRRLAKTIVLVTHDIDEAILLGDRVAILNVGGKLEQYAAPSEILASPANDFVRSFLGSDRGIKRLSLIPVAEVIDDAGPIVPPGADAATLDAVMHRYGVDWAAFTDGTSLIGWLGARDAAAYVAGGTPSPHPFPRILAPEDSLKEALDLAISSHPHAAPVTDGKARTSVLTVEMISRTVVER